MDARRIHKLFTAFLLVSAVSLVLPLPKPLRVAFSFLQAYYIPGIVFLRYVGDRGRPRLDDLFLPPLLSPVLVTIFVFVFHMLTGSLDRSITISMILFYALLALTLIKRPQDPTAERQRIPGAVIILSLASCAIVIATYIANNYMLVYTDAWHHASVANEILDRGIPPMEPRFTDVPIRYMWIYHLFQAVWQRLSGLEISHVLGVFNVMVAFVFPYLMARLASLFTTRRSYILATPAVAFIGIQSAVWIFFPLRLLQILFGDVRGTAEIARMLDRVELNGAEVISILSAPYAWTMSILDKFLTITALNYAYNLFLLCFILVIGKEFQKRTPVKAALSIFVVLLGGFLFHVVPGLATILTAVGAGVLVFLYDLLRYGRRASRFQSVVIPCTAVAALVAGFPYFHSLTGGEGGGDFIRDHLHLGFTNLWTIITTLLALLPFSLRALKRLVSEAESEVKMAGAWSLCLFVLCIFVELPGIAENKIIFPLLLLLTFPIVREIVNSISASRGKRRILLYTWLLVIFIIPSVMTVRGFMLEKPETTQYEKRCRISREERELYNWIRENTDISSIIIERNTYNLMPVYARRRNFLLKPTFIRVHNYGEQRVKRYVEIHRQFFAPEPIPAMSIEYLANKGRPYYVVLWNEDIVPDPWLREKFASRPDWFTLAYENEAGVVFRLIS